MARYVLGSDVGGTNLRVALVNSSGEILLRERCPTPKGTDGDAIVDALVSLARACWPADIEIEKIGVAVPASGMDYVGGIVTRSPNLPGLNGLRLAEKVNEHLGLDCRIENDATAATIGENWLGASRGFSNVLGITLGTGVGGGIIMNGSVLRGPDGTAGEIGHMSIVPNGRPCARGSHGCLEQYASATAVVRMAVENGVKGTARGDLTAEQVHDAALCGDPSARKTFDTMGYYLGVALSGVVNLLNPEIIVLGGGLSGAWDTFIDPVREEIWKRAFREPALRVKLVRAGLGDDAGILGVARLAFASPTL
jgi:glucokinase